MIEVVPPQHFPARFPSVTAALDFQTRYVVQTAAKKIIRALDQMEIVSL